VQLIVLGNAFGGKIRDGRWAWWMRPWTQAIRIKEAFDAVRANMRTFVTIPYDNEVQARRTCAREDSGSGNYSSAVFEDGVREKPSAIALIVDNSDNFMSSTFESEMADLTNALNQPERDASVAAADGAGGGGTLSVYRVHEVSVAGSITLAMFVS